MQQDLGRNRPSSRQQQNALAITAAIALAFIVTLGSIAIISGLVFPTLGVAAVPTATPVPTVTPTPFDPSVGAPLPNSRIVAYYGIANSQTDFNGPASFIPFTALAKLKALGQQYQTADPATPVMLGLDVVVNVFQNCLADPVDFPQCSGTVSPDTIQYYIDFCNQNHLLLFLDVQLGETPVKDMVNQLSPYLEKYPFVELELDTEFHFPPGTRPSTIFFSGGGYARGSMDASEINWAIDDLAQLSLQYKVPRKVLVVNQFDTGIITHVDQIIAHVATTKPNVSFVQQMDGFGAQSDKVSHYADFVTNQRVQFGGFKLFYAYDNPAAARDYPLMTPQQVIALTPSPLFLTYQ